MSNQKIIRDSLEGTHNSTLNVLKVISLKSVFLLLISVCLLIATLTFALFSERGMSLTILWCGAAVCVVFSVLTIASTLLIDSAKKVNISERKDFSDNILSYRHICKYEGQEYLKLLQQKLDIVQVSLLDYEYDLAERIVALSQLAHISENRIKVGTVLLCVSSLLFILCMIVAFV